MDKVVIVTGSSGIGAATARLAASLGARVMVAGLDEEECRALADGIGGEWAAGDLSRECVARSLAERCVDRFGRIDGLFNVAGISGRRFGDGPVHECTEEGWDATFANNLKTMFLASRAVLPHMMERRSGAILNMASVVALSPEPRHFATHAYAATKGAAIALTRAMAACYAPHGIRVNAIAPGLVRTPMSRRAQSDPELLDYMKTKQPLAGGMIDPEDIARTAVFLLSEDARHITGQVLPVDAGWSVSA